MHLGLYGLTNMQTYMLHICGVLFMNAFMLGFCFLALSLLPLPGTMLCCKANLFWIPFFVLNNYYGCVLILCFVPMFQKCFPTNCSFLISFVNHLVHTICFKTMVFLRVAWIIVWRQCFMHNFHLKPIVCMVWLQGFCRFACAPQSCILCKESGASCWSPRVSQSFMCSYGLELLRSSCSQNRLPSIINYRRWSQSRRPYLMATNSCNWEHIQVKARWTKGWHEW